MNSYTITLSVDQTPIEAFNAINNVRGWWTEVLEGSTEKLNDEFEVRFGDVHYSKHKLMELVPGKKVVWLITDSKLNFLSNKNEWTGTSIVFDITEENGKTNVQFTHEGLVPDIECYKNCSNAWAGYVKNSLLSLIATGKGNPARKAN